MTQIELRSRVGPDGVLTLAVPVGAAEANREVIVTVRTADPKPPHDPEEWRRFVESTAGSWKGEPFVRPQQGEFEKRDEWP